jgi:hypothetical protein
MFDIFGESDSDDLVFPHPLNDSDLLTFDIISQFIMGYGFPNGWSDQKMTDEINRFMDMVWQTPKTPTYLGGGFRFPFIGCAGRRPQRRHW